MHLHIQSHMGDKCKYQMVGKTFHFATLGIFSKGSLYNEIIVGALFNFKRTPKSLFLFNNIS